MNLRRGFFRLWIVGVIIWVPLATYVVGLPKIPPDRIWPLDTTFCHPEPWQTTVPRLPVEECEHRFAVSVYGDWMRFGEHLGEIILPPFVLILLVGATYWVHGGFRDSK
jgi:hypothetical protein